jgi:1-pyrroline-5-carboxylate dehydrogenase
MATYSNYLVYKILVEAGLPAGVIQFCPGPAEEIVKKAIDHPEFAALHFTGSTFVFRQLWKQMASNLDIYRSYPRIVGETGGKNFHLVHPSANIEVAVQQSIRAAFEFAGQKCSALSRLYVAQSVWQQGFKDSLLHHAATISVGPVEEFKHFMGPVINKASFDKIVDMIKSAKEQGGQIIFGGSGDDSRGYFVQPTIIETQDPKSITMSTEIFGPVLTVYVYPDEQFEDICGVIDTTSQYSLTGAIFSQDRYALIRACDLLKNASGMLYIGGEKCTGAVVGQQPFGGGRASGTNDRAGSMMALSRFTSARTIKEGFNDLTHFAYPSNAM